MDKKSKIFFLVFALLIAGSVALTFWRIMIARDYMIEAQAECDPKLEKCFVTKCDPANLAEGETCSDDPQADTSYYKIIKRKASRIPLCDPTSLDCRALVCETGEADCEYTYCDETNKEEQVAECNDPSTYVEPVTDTSVQDVSTCATGDVCDQTPASIASSSTSTKDLIDEEVINEADIKGKDMESEEEFKRDEVGTGSDEIVK